MIALTLYGWDQSTYSRSVLLALREKGLDFDFITVDPFAEDGLSTDYLAMQPLGKIPVLVEGDFQIYETAAILRYLDEGFAGPALQPGDSRRRARMQQIIALLDNYGYQALVWDLFVNLREGPVDEEVLARGRSIGARVLSEIDRLMEGPWLCGDDISLADCHLAPILRYALAVSEGEALVAEQPDLLAWWDRAPSRSGWQEVLGPLAVD